MATFEAAETNVQPGDGQRPQQPHTLDAAGVTPTDSGRPTEPVQLDAAAVEPTDRDRPQPQLDASVDAAAVSSSSRPQPARPSDQLRPGIDAGIVIPGDFARVVVRCVDTKGEPLENVEWVMSSGTFPTAARVDDNGEAYLWLLATEYESFMAVASSGSLDLTWYSSAEEQEPINPVQQDVGTIVLEPRFVGGTNAGPGVSFGL